MQYLFIIVLNHQEVKLYFEIFRTGTILDGSDHQILMEMSRQITTLETDEMGGLLHEHRTILPLMGSPVGRDTSVYSCAHTRLLMK